MRAMTVLAVVAVVLMAVVSLHAFQPKQQHHTVRNIPLTKRLFRVYHSDNTMAEQELLLSYAKPSLKVKLADSLLNSVFSIRPLFLKARDSARNSMIVRGGKIGVDWKERIARYEADLSTLQDQYNHIVSSKVLAQYPSYYLKPFHAYDEGNLSWQAAMEVESAALTVHAQIFPLSTPSLTTASDTVLDEAVQTKKKDKVDIPLNPMGDFLLRDNFHKNMLEMLQGNQHVRINRILDIGCSTGLSTLKLHESFPQAEIIGMDLSPYMLAVGNYNLQQDEQLISAKQHITFMHGLGEDTTLGRNDVDLVSMCLVAHELPQSASRVMFEEVYRILPNGGVFAFMDMDPLAENFKKFASNPFAFAAFKSTEPWIREYVSMDIMKELRETGFKHIEIKSNSPRHRTIVAFK